jgi:hypothetical protein
MGFIVRHADPPDRTPYRGPIATPIWVRLDAVFPHPPDAPRTTVADGWDLTTNAPGHLWPDTWIRSARGMWLATCSFTIPSADSRRTHKVDSQLVPAHALRQRPDQGASR